MTERPLRVMWLLNHTSARNFEIPMLKRIGVKEIFLPKKTPADPTFRSTSVDWSEDANLSIPKEDLATMNAADWYDDPGSAAWANRQRTFRCSIFHCSEKRLLQINDAAFSGREDWRAYGLPKISYHDLLTWLAAREAPAWPVAAKNLWFGKAYNHLSDIEPDYIAKKAIFLPAGLPDTDVRDSWIGDDKRILFVCPDLAVNPFFQEIYRDFRQTFDGLPYVIAGAQPVVTKDNHVLGYLPKAQHDHNMRQLRVMFYHSTERNHVHYHPFEAIQAGMPLVFMAGGLLDTFGGIDLPGRCRDSKEAREKVARILDGDRRLIDDIRRSQRPPAYANEI